MPITNIIAAITQIAGSNLIKLSNNIPPNDCNELARLVACASVKPPAVPAVSNSFTKNNLHSPFYLFKQLILLKTIYCLLEVLIVLTLLELKIPTF